jgi:hypothetical protein
MSDLLGTHTFHNLDEEFPGWAILANVLPLFVADMPWTVSIPMGRPPTAAASDEVEFDNLKREFRIKIGALPDLLPEKTLSAQEFNVCKNALMPLLHFLENVVPISVPISNTHAPAADEYDKAEDSKKKKDEKSQRMAGVRAWASVLIPAGWTDAGTALVNNLSRFITAAVAYTQAAGTATAVRRGTAPRPAPDTGNNILNLDKLRTLGEFIQKNIGGDLVELCKPYLRLELDLQEFKEAADHAEDIAELFKDAAIPEPEPGGQEVSETNWKELKPRQVSCKLFYLLRERTSCQPENEFQEAKFHEAKLQLDGSQLDSLGESVRLDIFLSSCPPLPPTWWRQGWYTLVSRSVIPD